MTLRGTVSSKKKNMVYFFGEKASLQMCFSFLLVLLFSCSVGSTKTNPCTHSVLACTNANPYFFVPNELKVGSIGWMNLSFFRPLFFPHLIQ